MKKNPMNFEKNNFYQNKALNLIPGGAHTYSKGMDQFPENAPKIIDRAEGCYLWDVDGNKWLDLAMSLGSVILGHGHKPVLDAVYKQMLKGTNFTRPSIIEAELAEMICDLVPSAEMVKFAKNGSDATTAATKLSRAYTSRDLIVRCIDDPFNSVDDWFIGSTVVKRGIPSITRELTLTFKYNDIQSLENLFEANPNKIACVIFEPISLTPPEDGFLEKVQSLCKKNGSVLIFDEVVSGFRFDTGGVQKMIGVTPDLSCFGKSIANGFSVSAIAGKRDIMKLGGLDHNEERVFLLSTTHGAEAHALAAAKACIKEIVDHKMISHFWSTGSRLQSGVASKVKEMGCEEFVKIIGYGCKPAIIPLDENGNPSMIARTLFLQETCKRGLLVPYIVPGWSHKENEINTAIRIISEAIYELKVAHESGGMLNAIQGALVKPVFRPFN